MLTGDTLGPYRVLDKLGEGGMGAVYRARDTKLNRDVALKVLPEAFANDADRLARFTREAQTLASLNHPNIAAIHGLEESGGVRALVMELVEGEDLSTLIARGSVDDATRPQAQRRSPKARGLPVDEALPIAKQIAEALEAAHEQGIIHRDLKPANIKVRADGTVKVLDFGLAKALDTGAGGAGTAGQAGMSMSPTLTSPAMMTGVGVILGTAAYMSPEQARGKPVDKRADIWAFGAVLFEVLTGQRAFGGEDVAQTLANVINKEPEWDTLPTATPTHIRQTLRLCLRKPLRERMPDIGAVRLALDGAFEPEALQAVVNAHAVKPLWRRALPVVAAVVLTAALVSGVERSLRPVPAPRGPAMRFQVPLPSGRQFGSMTRQQVALSPDGTRMVYVANRALYLRAIDDVEPRAIPDTLAFLPNSPVFSPDGQSIAFFSHGTLSLYAQASDGGGVAERLTTAAQGVSQVPDSWSPDGRTLLFSEQRSDTFSLMALSVRDKGAVPFGGVQSREAAEAVFSPDGRWVAYNVNNGFGGAPSPDRGIFVQPFPATGATYQVPKTLLDFHPAWAPSGGEIFYVSTVAAEDLTAVSVQAQASVTFGVPVSAGGVAQPGITSSSKRGYDVLQDGRFISLLPADNAASGGAPPEMHVVLNWFEELKRLVPPTK